MSRKQSDDKETTNSTLDKRLRWDRNSRKTRRCTLCPPNKGENRNRQAKHGTRKPKKKDHRR